MDYLKTPTPAPKSMFKEIYENVILNSFSGKSSTVAGIPKIGTVPLLKYLILKLKDYDTESIRDNVIWVWLDLQLLLSNKTNGFISIINDILDKLEQKHPNKYKKYKDTDRSLSGMKRLIKRLTWDDDLNLSFIINDFDEIWLEDIRDNKFAIGFISELKRINPMKIGYIFIVHREWNVKTLLRTDKLSTHFTKNIYWIKPGNHDWGILTVSNLKEMLNIDIGDEFSDRIVDITGSYPSLIKNFVEYVSSDKELEQKILDTSDISELYELLGSDNLDLRFSYIFDSLLYESKVWLLEKDGETTDFLKNSGVVKKTGDSFEIFSPLFEWFLEKNREYLIKGLDKKNKSTQQSNQKTISEIKSHLTGQESLIIDLLLKNDGELVGKETIAKKIWGADWSEHYSEWALDKAISRLSNKLEKNNSEKRLKVVRNRGVLLI